MLFSSKTESLLGSTSFFTQVWWTYTYGHESFLQSPNTCVCFYTETRFALSRNSLFKHRFSLIQSSFPLNKANLVSYQVKTRFSLSRNSFLLRSKLVSSMLESCFIHSLKLVLFNSWNSFHFILETHFFSIETLFCLVLYLFLVKSKPVLLLSQTSISC